MPELPEVRNAVSRIFKAVKNKTILEVIVNNPKLIKDEDFSQSIINNKIINVINKGKFIIFNLSNGMSIINHLRMTGKFRFEEELKQKKHDHVIFKLDEGYLYFSDSRAFGTFNIRNSSNMYEVKPLSNVGPEAKDVDINSLYEKVSKSITPIKTFLLNQSHIAGLGNIYINEVLFESKIDPSTPSRDISLEQLTSILNWSEKIMTLATTMGGSSITNYESFNGEKGTYQTMLKVHLREGKPCLTCRTEIEKKRINGRGTYWCPNCQK